jgi:CHAT domain-containing protein/Flp pilus assembly protein TadD
MKIATGAVITCLLLQFCTATAAPSIASDTAEQSLDQVRLLYEQGKYQSALPIALDTLAKAKKKFGPGSLETAPVLHELGRIEQTIADFKQSEVHHLQALAIQEKTLGRANEHTANSLNWLGRLYTITGRYKGAEAILNQALEISRAVCGEEDTRTTKIMLNVGSFYNANGETEKAEQMLRHALDIDDRLLGRANPETLELLHALASNLAYSKKFAEAESLFKQLILLREKLLGPDHPKTSYSVGLLGVLYKDTGRYREAEPILRRIVELRQRTLGPEHPFTAHAIYNLGLLYQNTGAIKDALRLHQQALDIYEKAYGVKHADSGCQMNNLGGVYHLMGEYTKAELLYTRAIATMENIVPADNACLIAAVRNLGELYSDIGGYEKAEPMYRYVLAITEGKPGRFESETSRTMYRLANLYEATGAYSKAEELKLRALKITRASLGASHPYAVELLNSLGTLNWRKGDMLTAQKSFSEAQSIYIKGAEVFLAINSAERKRAYIDAGANNIYKHVSYSIDAKKQDSIRLGLTDVLQFKGRVLDESSDEVSRLRRSVNSKDKALFDELASVATQLSNLTYQTSDKSTSNNKQEVDALLQRQSALETQLASRSDAFRRQSKSMTLDQVRRQIPSNAALVEWFRYKPFDPRKLGVQWGAERYVAYVLRPTGDPTVVDLGDAKSIDDRAHAFLAAIGNAANLDVKARAKALSDLIFKPLQPHLVGVDHVLASPDGALNQVPFAALADDKLNYLATRLQFTYVTSGRDLARMTFASSSSAPGDGNQVVVADPTYGTSGQLVAQTESGNSQRSADLDRGGLIFRPLSATAQEAQALQALMKSNGSFRTAVLTQDNATESNIKQLHSPRILHVASHGFFLSDQIIASQRLDKSADINTAVIGENPLLRSGIALAGANARRSGPNDDGILTALEVAQLDLHGTELVVLSACETGLGEIQNGEGVYGLRRALVLAGAQTQITSLWKVADEPTRSLIVDYYQRLLKGEGRSAALRNAQLTMLATADRSHPYYWAGFIPVGNWAPLRRLH